MDILGKFHVDDTVGLELETLSGQQILVEFWVSPVTISDLWQQMAALQDADFHGTPFC